MLLKLKNTMQHRRADYDVTDSIQVSSTQTVGNTVLYICKTMYPGADFSKLERSFADFDNLFEGLFQGYNACDTFYHDKQHSLDMTLALARIIEGHERVSKPEERFGPNYIIVTLITALFHDSGYIRETDDENINGAVYTKVHVTRSAEFLTKYLQALGMEQYASIAGNIVHYTGYELAPENISLPETRLHILGYMLGTADLIAQMSDRCYLEKCRDRLYPEFVLGGISTEEKPDGTVHVIYKSGNDLLKQTPTFYKHEISKRLDGLFQSVYKYVENHFGDSNYYLDALVNNQTHLQELIQADKLDTLKRIPLTNNGTLNAELSKLELIKSLNIH